jgi:hypothetical protein
VLGGRPYSSEGCLTKYAGSLGLEETCLKESMADSEGFKATSRSGNARPRKAADPRKWDS